MHAKVLQQLGWLYHQQNNSYETQDRAISYLEKSVAAGMATPQHTCDVDPTNSG